MFDMSMMRKIEQPVVSKVVQSPVGPLTLLASEIGLHALLWEEERALCEERFTRIREDSRHALLVETERQLGEYFDGARRTFDLPLAPRGTPFQMQVWDLLSRIPYGEIRTYGGLATELGDTKRARAVGMANGKNPIAIIIPCHRVIGSAGTLTGFGGGLDNKAFLLALEQRFRGAEAPLLRS